VIVVDSSGWLEFLTDGPHADAYAEALADPARVLTPAIVLYEVYRWVRRVRGEEMALQVAAQLTRTAITAVDQTTALTAADLSLAHRLAMADALVYATGRIHDAVVMTSDADFEGLDGVRYLAKA
jgi:predicted nucleic acid-binding protein